MAIRQRTKSLKARTADLSNTFFQLDVLNGKEITDEQFEPFSNRLKKTGDWPLRPNSLEIFQINVGKLCNQTCIHCHVDAGPDRTEEVMTRADLEKCLEIILKHDIPMVDLTGGAPEMNPHFRWFVESCASAGRTVMNRCNLTIIVANKKYNDLPEFFAENKVHVISSLPFYNEKRTDAQRGDGVFADSIKALKMLNDVGYGREGTNLKLDLVYNPGGAFLSAGQAVLEPQFKSQLKRRHDIEFNNLLAINNLPISRFLEYLLQSGNYAEYMDKLVGAYNPATIKGLMCRNTISVSWDGYLYDCDFNQMLELKVDADAQHIRDFDLDQLNDRLIVTNQHCYGCTAGAGSSCGGEITA